MHLMREFEDRLGNIVEGTFGAMFRSPVQPAELARAASKEMSKSRKLGLDKMYVSNVYFVFVSQRDADTMGDLVHTVEGELETYLMAFARERDYHVVTRPVVRFSVDADLKRLGKFDIISQQMTAEAIYAELGSVAGVTDGIDAAQAQMPAAAPPVPAPQAPAPASVPLSVDAWANAPAAAPAPVPVPPVAPAPAVAPVVAPQPEARPVTAVVSHARISSPELGEVAIDPGRSYVAGRQSTCDFPVSDANVSRQHAEIYWDGEGWSVRDLGSTNGTLVNGYRIANVELHDGDTITLGISTFTFHDPGAGHA